MQKFMNGWVNGFIGVAIFAGSLPATRVAVTGFEPGFLTAARAVSIKMPLVIKVCFKK